MNLWNWITNTLDLRPYAGLPQPIAPESHRDACLCEACECCADPAMDIPEEAR